MDDNSSFPESQIPPPAPTPAMTSSAKPVLLWTAAAVAFLLVAGGSFAYFAGFTPFGNSTPNYAQAPKQSNALDFKGLSADMRLSGSPLVSPTDATTAVPQLLRFVGSRSTILTRVGGEDEPSWSVAIPHQSIDTSNDGPIDDGLGDDTTVKESPEAPELEGTPAVCRALDASVKCGDRTVSLADGSVTISDRTGDVDPDPATSSVPLDSDDDGTVTGPGGVAYDGLRFEPGTHVSMTTDVRADDDQQWVVSDGRTLAVVDAENVVWTQELDPTVAEVTGLGDERIAPSWAVVDGTLIIGAGDGVRGLDVMTGKQQWAVSAVAEGFAVTGTELRIQQDGRVSTFDFADSAKDDTVIADSDFEHTIPAVPVAKRPTTDAIRNATVAIPAECAEFGGQTGANQKFTNGKTVEGEFREQVTMKTITPSIAAVKPLVAIEFACYSGGNWVTNSVGIYDQDLNLVTPVEPWAGKSELSLVAEFARSMFSSITMTGPYMTATLDNIAVYGDEDFNAAERTAGAEVRYVWEKSGYQLQDVLFDVHGKTIRVPDVDDVQKFVEAAAEGDNRTAATMASQDVMKGLDQVIGDPSANPPLTYRDLALQKGTKVDSCELIGVTSGEYSDYTLNNGISLMEGMANPEPDRIRSGDVICGLAYPGDVFDPDSDSNWYVGHLLLRGNDEGKVQVYVVSAYTG